MNCSRSYMWVILALLVAGTGGCAHALPHQLALVEPARTFVLDFAVRVGERNLPPGRYDCVYRNASGLFCQAPETLSSQHHFGDGTSGGVYVPDSRPLTAFLYHQDKHPTTTYVTGVGPMSFGGSGGFNIDDTPLPATVTHRINF